MREILVREVSALSCSILTTPGTQSVTAAEATVDGITVTLLDTPAFNDKDQLDLDILSEVARHLRMFHQVGFLLNGVIILHPLLDERVRRWETDLMSLLYHVIGKEFVSRQAIIGCTKTEGKSSQWINVCLENRVLSNECWGQFVDAWRAVSSETLCVVHRISKRSYQIPDAPKSHAAPNSKGT